MNDPFRDLHLSAEARPVSWPPLNLRERGQLSTASRLKVNIITQPRKIASILSAAEKLLHTAGTQQGLNTEGIFHRFSHPITTKIEGSPRSSKKNNESGISILNLNLESKYFYIGYIYTHARTPLGARGFPRTRGGQVRRPPFSVDETGRTIGLRCASTGLRWAPLQPQHSLICPQAPRRTPIQRSALPG